jgi:hypothetical protein
MEGMTVSVVFHQVDTQSIMNNLAGVLGFPVLILYWYRQQTARTNKTLNAAEGGFIYKRSALVKPYQYFDRVRSYKGKNYVELLQNSLTNPSVELLDLEVKDPETAALQPSFHCSEHQKFSLLQSSAYNSSKTLSAVEETSSFSNKAIFSSRGLLNHYTSVLPHLALPLSAAQTAAKAIFRESSSAGNYSCLGETALSTVGLDNEKEGLATLSSSKKKFAEIERISDHMKKHAKPSDDTEFAYYLAGLIEGSGNFGDQLLEILFFEKDISLAYYIKKRIGYGTVRSIKDKRAVIYVLRHRIGLKYVLNLVNGKFLTNCKINQLLKHDYCRQLYINAPVGVRKLGVSRLPSVFTEERPEAQEELAAALQPGMQILPPANFSLMTNHYLAGFTDMDGYFGISTPKDKSSKLGIKVKFIFVLGQKDPTILQKVKSEFGGYLYHYKSQNNYLLELSTLTQNFKIIEYFDKFHLNSMKHLAFFKWRKAYRIVQRKEHLTEKGLSKIKLLGKSISELLK